MFIDLCFPKNNEKAFIEIAARLGTKALCFIYDSKAEIEKFNKTRVGDVQIYRLISNQKPRFSSKLTRGKATGEKLAVFYEFKKLDPFLCRLLQRHYLGISFASLLISQNRTAWFQESMEWIKLINKYHNNIITGSFARGPYQLRSLVELQGFTHTLSLREDIIKKGFQNLSILLQHNKK